jgi:hypothetical protein
MVEYRRKKVLEIMNVYRPKNILEIGSGLISIFDFYHDYDSFIAVEPSKLFIDSLYKSEYIKDKRITIINDYFENVADKLAVNDFDFIILSSLLHEVNNPSLLLRSIKKFQMIILSFI